MALKTTRPRGEQVRFNSARTGNHILDEYLERCEKGSRSISDLLDDLFDNNGALRWDLYEWRTNPLNPYEVQYRVGGDYIDPDANWSGAIDMSVAFAAGLLAQKWAEFMGGTVDGVGYSAKYWATKLAGDYGYLATFFLGAHLIAPTTMSDGRPLVPGAMYFSLQWYRPHVWNGSSWTSFEAPMPAAMTTLVYNATASQTDFYLATTDLNGASYTLDDGDDPEGIMVTVSGQRLAIGQQFTVDYQNNRVQLVTGASLNDLVQIDVLMAPTRMREGSVRCHALRNFDLDPDTGLPGYVDGVRTDFTLFSLRTSANVSAADPSDVLIYVDGVAQEPGVDYTVSGSTLSMTEAPQIGQGFRGVYFQAAEAFHAELDDIQDRLTIAEGELDGLEDAVHSSTNEVTDIQLVTQAEYDGMSVPRPATVLYLIEEEA